MVSQPVPTRPAERAFRSATECAPTVSFGIGAQTIAVMDLANHRVVRVRPHANGNETIAIGIQPLDLDRPATGILVVTWPVGAEGNVELLGVNVRVGNSDGEKRAGGRRKLMKMPLLDARGLRSEQGQF